MSTENKSVEQTESANKKRNSSARKPQRRRRYNNRSKAASWNPEQFVVPEVEGKKRFLDFNLPDDVLHAVYDLKFEYCTGIQAETIPAALDGKHSTFELAKQALSTGTSHAVVSWPGYLKDEEFNDLESAAKKGKSHGIIIRRRQHS